MLNYASDYLQGFHARHAQHAGRYRAYRPNGVVKGVWKIFGNVTCYIYLFRYPRAKGVWSDEAVSQPHNQHRRFILKAACKLLYLLGHGLTQRFKQVKGPVYKLGRVQRYVDSLLL